LVEIVLLERGWVTLSANFRGKGVLPPTNFSARKLDYLGYHVVLFADYDSTSFYLSTITWDRLFSYNLSVDSMWSAFSDVLYTAIDL